MSTKTVKFTITGAQLDAARDRAHAQYGKNYRVAGFRDGRAPRRVVEQNHGDIYLEHALNDIFNAEYTKYLAAHPEIRPIDDPEIHVEPREKDLELSVKIDVQDPFTLGKYTGLEVVGKKIEITDKDVDKFLERLRVERARELAAPAGHKIAAGDIAVIDFVGSVAGKEFEGGKGANHRLEIGSHSFIDTFEDQLVGHAAGDKVDVNVTFPKDYHAKELAGKRALFRVTVKEVSTRQLPTLDDNFAKESSEFETIADFKRDVRARLEQQSAMECTRYNDDELLRTIAFNTKVDVHPKLAESQYNQMMGDLEQKLQKSGLNLEMYAMYMGKTLDQFTAEQHEFAKSGARTGLVLDAISKKENIHDFDKLVEFLRKNNKITFKGGK